MDCTSDKKIWFHSLTTNQLRDLCRATHIPHHGGERLQMVKDLCETKVSSVFASANVVSIKEMCRSRSLPISGRKYQLVLRVLAHDALKEIESTAGNESKISIYELYNKMERSLRKDSNAFTWLAETVCSIVEDIPQVDPAIYETRTDFPEYYDWNFQTPVAALRDVQSIFTVFLGGCTPNAATDRHDNVSVAIQHLRILVVEARVFMSKAEKKRAVKWILEFNNFLVEFMLNDHSEPSLTEIIKLLENDNYYLPASPTKPTEITEQKQNNEPARAPFRSLENVDTNVEIDMSSILYKKMESQLKTKVILTKKEIVYKEMVRFLKKRDVNSDDVYEKMVILMESILRKCDYYESLRLFRSIFLALVVHYEKIVNPGIDNEHNFTLAIDLLGDVVENVLDLLSCKEKEDTIIWMTNLQTLTKPHGLGDIAERPLNELISMVKKGMVVRRLFSA